MPVGRCKDCHYDPLSDSARSCPNCGSISGAEFAVMEFKTCNECAGYGRLGLCFHGGGKDSWPEAVYTRLDLKNNPCLQHLETTTVCSRCKGFGKILQATGWK